MSIFDLTKIEWKETRHQGIFLHTLWRDKQSGDTAVLVRMQPAAIYPRHRHIGNEDVLVLQGGFKDEQYQMCSGEFRRYPANSEHHPVGLPGKDCILFAIAHSGIELID
jgi:anti-sigma factor ChrR (cupin superfamily)